MKRSEKLFMLINKIDENIINEAKPEAQKPNRITIEKRAFPIKETLAFAACFAVLAAGIFAIMRFRLNSPGPVDSNPGSSDVSAVTSYDDEELREILRDLAANAVELDGMFTESGSGSTSYRLKVSDADYRGEYSSVSDQDRTEPNGLFAMPQSRDEMETLLLTTFTQRAVEYYMYDIGTGKLTADYNGSTVIMYDEPLTSRKKFIEIDGQLYREMSSNHLKWRCDPETAHIISKTDKTIRFSYSGIADGSEDWDDDIGTVIFENGGWKLDYFHDDGFIPELPTEFTEDDIELQGILSRLTPADKIAKWFSCPEGDYETQTFAFAETGYLTNVRFAKFPTGAFTGEDNYPHSLNELEQLMLKYFTQDAVDSFMEQADHAEFQNVPNTSDGVYSVVLTKPINGDMDTPSVLEIDGELYHAVYVKGSGEVTLLDTAKVTEKTDSLIKYSCIHEMNRSYYNVDGVIEYERGGWRRNPFYKPAENVDPDAENKELREILNNILPSARDLDNLFTQGIGPSGDEYVFVYDDKYNSRDTYYQVTAEMKTRPNGLFAVPLFRDSTEDLLSKCFSKRAVKTYLKNISDGTMVKNSDGTYTVTTDQGYLTTFIYINGQIFCRRAHDSARLNFDPTSASIVSKTDKTIRFSFTSGESSNSREGVLVYEDGSWKLNHFYWGGFITEYPTEFTDEDEELQDILNALSPGETIRYWFNSAGDTFTADHFVFEGLEDAEKYPTYYYKLPTGKFDGGKEEYPRSYNELQALLLKYCTQKTADQYMQRANKGTFTSISGNDYYIKTEKPVTAAENIPSVIELDGVMYYKVSEKSGSGSGLWDTATVTSRTDDTINYSYLYKYIEYGTESGTIKYERGGWRTEIEPPVQNAHEINTDILSDLGSDYYKLVDKHGKLKTNTYKGVMFENSRWLYGWKSESGGDFYVDNDHTNPGTLPEAGGCNVILGVRSSELLTNFTSPMTFDDFCERYGFTLVSAEKDFGNYGYDVSFTHPQYPGVKFISTSENNDEISYQMVWWIFLDVDCKDAKPII